MYRRTGRRTRDQAGRSTRVSKATSPSLPADTIFAGKVRDEYDNTYEIGYIPREAVSRSRHRHRGGRR